MQYFGFQKFHDGIKNPEQRWFELSDGLAVKKMIRIECDGSAISTSIAIFSHHNSAFGDFAYGRTDPCLWTNSLSSTAQLIDKLAGNGFKQIDISIVEFGRKFMPATPDMSVDWSS